MNGRKILVVVAMMALIMGGGTLSASWASEPPPATGQTVGPEIWGTLVINESPAVATVRVKRVQNCNVLTEAEYVTTGVNFPESATDPVNYTWDAGTFNDIGNDLPQGGVPIITKVKNFKIEGTSPNRECSFDAQIMFHIY